MEVNTKNRKNARRGFEQIFGRQALIERMYQIVSQGKQGLDVFLLELGRMMAETIMYIDREEVAGPDYHPKDCAIQKWASQGGGRYTWPIRRSRWSIRGCEGRKQRLHCKAIRK